MPTYFSKPSIYGDDPILDILKSRQTVVPPKPTTTTTRSGSGAGYYPNIGGPGISNPPPPPGGIPDDAIVLPPPTGDPELPPVTPPDIPEPEEFDFYAAAQVLFPYLPTQILDIYATAWADSGDQDLAWAYTTQHQTFDEHFRGIKRADGSMRMTLAEYLGTRHAYEDRLFEAGVNPEVFQSQITLLFEGNVSASEFRSRVDALEERITSQEEDLKRVYADYYGLQLDHASLVASVLDPAVGEAVIGRRITIAEIGGEASLQRFALSREAAIGLQQAGIDQASARQLFQTAGGVLPSLGRAALRHNEGTFDLESFIGSQVYSRPEETQRLNRVLASEAASFASERTEVRRTERGITGLRPR